MTRCCRKNAKYETILTARSVGIRLSTLSAPRIMNESGELRAPCNHARAQSPFEETSVRPSGRRLHALINVFLRRGASHKMSAAPPARRVAKWWPTDSGGAESDNAAP